MTEGDYQRRMSYRLLLATLWATLLLLAVEVIGGWATQSLTLLSESLHTLVNAFSTVLSLVAVTSPAANGARSVGAWTLRSGGDPCSLCLSRIYGD